MEQNKIVVFESKKIRRIWHNEEWYFSVTDVCGALTDSPDAGAYWRKLKQRLKEEGSEVVTFCHGLKLEASDGKKYVTDCANTKGMFRIIQSVPSPKAEPFKQWLAQVGAEISKATFGITPSEYKELKSLTKKNQNLRDHMTESDQEKSEFARPHDRLGTDFYHAWRKSNYGNITE